MKTLVFSDSHLGLPFEEKKYRFLLNIIKKADKVVINGDFWEGYLLNFEQFINSPWKHLFPHLKERNAIYIYGNHDRQLLSDDRAKLFSDIQTLRHEMPVNGHSLLLEHGNRIIHFFEHRMKHNKPAQFVVKRVNTIEKILFRNAGKKAVNLFFGNLNKVIKRQIKEELRSDQIYMCGHTHCAEFDLQNNFVNTGIIKHGIAQYLWIENGELIPQEEWYE